MSTWHPALSEDKLTGKTLRLTFIQVSTWHPKQAYIPERGIALLWFNVSCCRNCNAESVMQRPAFFCPLQDFGL